MKNVLIITFLVVTGITNAQEPEPIHSIAKILKSEDYYVQQEKLWKQEVAESPENGDAWYNYYAAARAMRNLTHGNADLSARYRKRCDSIVETAYALIPESFEANHMKFWNSGNNPDALKYLYKANEINPNDPRQFDDMMIRGEIAGKPDQRELYARKIYDSGSFSSGILNWGYNMLSELPENSVLFTAGDNDTYAAWICQDVKNFKKEVVVLNTSLLLLPDYRNTKFEQLGIPAYTKSESDFNNDYKVYGKSILDHVINNTDREIYFISSVSDNIKDQYADKLYLTGLSYRYCNSNIDNTSIIKRNYEKRYLMDYIFESFSPDISESVVNRLNVTYLPAMLKLYNHYKESENLTMMDKIKREIIYIAEKGNVQSEIVGYFAEGSEYPWVSSYRNMILNIKDLEQQFVRLSGNKHIGKYEVTNAQYKQFLGNLLRSRKVDLFSICIYDSAQWKVKFNYDYNDPMRDMYHWHPAYEHYPIVNISYVAANKYCEWLTQQYNVQRKRKYEKVLFRLPTNEEWETAANPKKGALTPWGTASGKKEDGSCYLANFQNSSGRFADDGGFHMVKVDSYLPNEIGGYNFLGNVAEMVQKEGIAKGGSWADLLEDCYIAKSTTYDGPDPRIGFRIVMEVIEE